MRKKMTILILPLIILSSARTAAADGPDLSKVAAEAVWVLHLDVQRAFDSKLGQFFLAHGGAFEFDDDMAGIEGELGFDPKEEIISILAYGAGFEEGGVVVGVQDGEKRALEVGVETSSAVVIAETTAVVDDLVKRLEAEEESYKRVEIDGYTLHTWEDAAGHVRPQGERRLVVTAEQPDAVVGALRVIDGKSPSMKADERAAAAIQPRAGSFLIAHVFDLAQLDCFDGPSAIIRNGKSAQIQIGERGETAFADIDFVAEDEEMAKTLVDLFNGLVALGRIVAEEEDDVEAFRTVMRYINVTAEDDKVAVRMHISVNDLEEIE